MLYYYYYYYFDQGKTPGAGATEHSAFIIVIIIS